MLFGVNVPGGAFGEEEVGKVAEMVGHRPDAVLWYEDFAAPVPVMPMKSVAASGFLPVTSWEPWFWHAAPATSAGLLPRIGAGEFDTYVLEWAEGYSTMKGNPHLRFAHEFNGHWYPWCTTGGTTPEQYVIAWRRIHDLFTKAGATDVRWMWSPAAYESGTALA
ncbi:glycosyl hydrolase, partial [Micrococcus luteus]|uniref:glycosyl hydrolase n=1 Tax=Micrococcus luteus TaxID=1270 RepID=UPI00343C3AC3